MPEQSPRRLISNGMKIAIDFREAASTAPAGKGEYVHQLCRRLLQVSSEAEFVFLTIPGQVIDLPRGNWRQKTFGGGALGWHIGVWFWLELLRPVDVYFSTTSVIVPACLRSVPCVTTLFDFTVWRYPKTHLTRAVWLEKIFMGQAIKHSHKLLAISNFIKQETITLFSTNPDKIIVTPLAADDIYQPMSLGGDEASALRRKYRLPAKFILYLGTIEPRKNIDLLIKAYQKIKSDIGDIKLVLAGSRGWHSREAGLDNDDIILPGYIEAKDKAALYNIASLFVFPSVYEGFGLPPLEAMTCGVPTIVSDRASLPEVVGGGAGIVSVDSPDNLASVILEILKSPDRQAELRRRGLDQARQFSWRRTAEVTWEVLKQYE